MRVDDVSGLIHSGKYNEAIELMAARLGVRAATYDPANRSDEVMIDAGGAIKLGRRAFFSPFPVKGKKASHPSESWLASSLVHASVRWEQRNGQHYRWGVNGTQGSLINEVEAYKAELENASRTGLTTREAAEVRQRYEKKLGLIRPPLNSQVANGQYGVPDIYQIPRPGAPSPLPDLQLVARDFTAGLLKQGFQRFASLEAAGRSMSEQAFKKTRKQSGDNISQPEYGGLIFKYGGSWWGQPPVPGQASKGGPVAFVDFEEIRIKLVSGLSAAGLSITRIVIQGLYHSHPSQPDLSGDDRISAGRLANLPKLGAMPLEFQASFVWGPKTEFLGGKDPDGKLYSYYPNR
jgi:hypothetical protein